MSKQRKAELLEAISALRAALYRIETEDIVAARLIREALSVLEREVAL